MSLDKSNCSTEFYTAKLIERVASTKKNSKLYLTKLIICNGFIMIKLLILLSIQIYAYIHINSIKNSSVKYVFIVYLSMTLIILMSFINIIKIYLGYRFTIVNLNYLPWIDKREGVFIIPFIVMICLHVFWISNFIDQLLLGMIINSIILFIILIVDTIGIIMVRRVKIN